VTSHKKKLTALIVILLCCHVIACAHTSMNASYQGPKARPDALEKEFDCKKFTGSYSSKVIEETDEFVLKQIQFTPGCNVSGLEHDIIMDYYDVPNESKLAESETDGLKAPVILVLPILGGSNYFANTFARYFADYGFSSLIVHRQKGYKAIKNLDKMDTILRQIVLDHKQALDWIEMQNDLDKDRIGVFGISMGSIKAALISSIDKRVKATVMCLTGGNIAEIITTSDEKGIVKRRDSYMEAHDLSQTEFADLLKSKITCDPINYAQYIDADNALMVLGRFDSTVPYKHGNALWIKMGEPEKITMPTGHYTAILGLYYVKMKSLDFFNRKLRY
jgi:dienelactone hydrolase family protein